MNKIMNSLGQNARKAILNKIDTRTKNKILKRYALLLDKDLKALGKVPLSELAPTLRNIDNVSTLILDGDIDKILVTNAEKAKVQNLIGNEVKVRKQDTRVNLFTAKEL